MQYQNTKLIIYNGNNVQFLNGSDILDNFNCKLIETTDEYTKYNILEELYIDSINKQNELEHSKITDIYIKNNETELFELFLNNSINYISNIMCFNNKNKQSFFTNDLENLEKKFMLQNLNKFNYSVIDHIESIQLTLKNGFLIGYWLLRGGFEKIKKDDIDHPSWSGKIEHIEIFKNLFNENTYLNKSFKNNLELIVLIDPEFTDFLKFYFKQSKNKTFPLWIYSAPIDFIQGLMYGLICANSYISIDSNNNYYLTIKIINSNLIHHINQLFEYRLNIYSKLIGDDKYLSFKINTKLFELIEFGKNEKLIFPENSDNIDPVINKEIKYNSFKILPWYKCKITKKTVESSFALDLDNNNAHMISNGLFTYS